MKKKWNKITPSIIFIAGTAFFGHSMEFDKHNPAIDIKQLHSHQETYETTVTRTIFTITNSSQDTTTTTSTTVDPNVFTK